MEGVGASGRRWAARTGILVERDVISVKFDEMGLRLGFVFQHIPARRI